MESEPFEPENTDGARPQTLERTLRALSEVAEVYSEIGPTGRPQTTAVIKSGTRLHDYVREFLPICADQMAAQIILYSISINSACATFVWRRSTAHLVSHELIFTAKKADGDELESSPPLWNSASTPGKGAFISFSGPDGVGKSTIIEIVKDQLREAYGDALQLRGYHRRPRLLPPLGDILRKINGAAPKQKSPATKTRELPSGRMGSCVRLMYYWSDFVLGHWRLIRPELNSGAFVLCDRHFADIVADPYKARLCFTSKMVAPVRHAIPRPDLAFVLRAPAEVIFQRKQELTREEIKRVNVAYDWLIGKGELTRIDNTDIAIVAAAQIVDHIILDRDARCRGEIDRRKPARRALKA